MNVLFNESGLKQCSNCKKFLPKEKFSKDKNTKSKYSYICKDCKKQYNKKYDYSEKNLLDKKKFPKKYWCYSTINNHKRDGYKIIFTHTDLYNFIQNKRICPICGRELNYNYKGTGKPSPDSPSLDRINSERIITLDNIIILCHECNAMKRSKSLNELYVWCKQTINFIEGYND